MANKTRNKIVSASTKDYQPAGSTLTGTWSVDDANAEGGRILIGSGGAALTEVERGGWVYDTTNFECYKVEDVISDDEILVRGVFTNTLSGATLKAISKEDAKVQFISIKAVGATPVNGVALAAGDVVSFGQPSQLATAGANFVDPVLIDGATGAATIAIQFK